MFSKLVSAALFAALAGRAVAATTGNFNFTIGKTPFLGNEVLDFQLPPLLSSCDAQCQTTKTAIAACDLQDTACFCAQNITNALQICEECMFTALIIANKPPPDVRAGSNQILSGWTANCAAIKVVVTPAIGLSLPESWDGPFVAVFPEGVGIAIAAIGGLLGSSLIYMLCNM